MAQPTEFKIGDVNYRANPMDARRQLHIAMKFAGVFGAFSDSDNPLAGVAAGLASMKTDDVDFIINACLAVVERQDASGAAWSPVLAPNGLIMFDDLRNDLAALIQMVIPVIEANIVGFLSALPKDFVARILSRIPKPSTS
jgi:hypothetical protein